MKSLASLLLLFATPVAALSAEYQTLGRIERVSPALDALIAPDTKIEKLCEGFQWCEGPVWMNGALLFSDVPRNVIHQWKEGATAATVFLQPSGMLTPREGFREEGSNGLLLDNEGKLVICEHGERRVARLEADGTQTSLVDRFEGKRFNSPNDGIILRNGDLIFTDPPYGLEKLNDSPLKEISSNAVYRFTPDRKLTAIIPDLSFPNGIAVSPNEGVLYVAVSDPKAPRVMAYDLRGDGTASNPRIFADGAAAQAKGLKGSYDGLKVDKAGNVFTSAPGGLQIISPKGETLGMIVTDTLISNCAWGDDGSTLYFTADHIVCRMKTKTMGDKFLAGKK